MASPVLRVTVPDIYKPTVLRDLSKGFFEQSLKGVNPDQEVISKINLIITREPFLKETDGAAITYNNYEKSTHTHEYSWTRSSENELILMKAAAAEKLPAEVIQARLAQIKAVYVYFLNNQKKVVMDELLGGLEDSWAGLREQIKKREQSVQPGRKDCLAFVEGKIELQIYTLDKESEGLESVETYETSFEICAES